MGILLRSTHKNKQIKTNMKKIILPYSVSLVPDCSKHTDRTTFYLRFRDNVKKEWIKPLARRLDFYAFGKKDITNFGKAELERAMAELEINKNGFLPKLDWQKDFFVFWYRITSTKFPKTEKSYNDVLKKLKKYIKSETLPFSEINEMFMLTYKKYLLENCKSYNGAAALFRVTKHIVKKGILHGLINASADVPGLPEIMEKFKEELTEDELGKVMGAHCKWDESKLAFTFACFTGLRYGDWQTLKWKNIIEEPNGDHFISINMKKTKFHIYNSLKPGLVETLNRRNGDDELIFPILSGGSASRINYHIKKLVNNAGVDKKITTHCARVTFATMVYNITGDIEMVRRALGHKNIETTKRYIRIPKQDMKDATSLKGMTVDFSKYRKNETTIDETPIINISSLENETPTAA